MSEKNKSLDMAKIAFHALEEKKAVDIRVLDIRDISIIADYFIIANGTNKNQVQAIADQVDEDMHKAGYEAKGNEGYSYANWILLDYNDIVVHIFDQENRLFYDLERIWRDGKEISFEQMSE